MSSPTNDDYSANYQRFEDDATRNLAQDPNYGAAPSKLYYLYLILMQDVFLIRLLIHHIVSRERHIYQPHTKQDDNKTDS